MKIRQRLCGFRGHKSKIYTGWMDNKPFQARLICDDCGYTTKWFPIPQLPSKYNDPNKQ